MRIGLFGLVIAAVFGSACGASSGGRAGIPVTGLAGEGNTCNEGDQELFVSGWEAIICIDEIVAEDITCVTAISAASTSGTVERDVALAVEGSGSSGVVTVGAGLDAGASSQILIIYQRPF